MKNKYKLVAILVCFAIQPAFSQNKNYLPDYLPNDKLRQRAPFPSVQDKQYLPRKIYKSGGSISVSALPRDKQAFMIFVEVIQLTRWEDSYNKSTYKDYFQKLKLRSLAVIRRVLDNSIVKSKWHAKPGPIDVETLSKYSPKDAQVNSLLKLAMELRTLDHNYRKKRIDTDAFNARKTNLLQEIRKIVQ